MSLQDFDERTSETFNPKILLKDHFFFSNIFSIIASISFCLVDYFYIKIIHLDRSLLLDIEQVLFIVISGVIFIFNESIIGNEELRYVQGQIRDIEGNEKTLGEILHHLSEDNPKRKSYLQEYLGVVNQKIETYFKEMSDFKVLSYRLYITILSIVLIVSFACSTYIKTDNILGEIILIIFKVVFIYQYFIIAIWALSSYQVNKSKRLLDAFFNVTTMVEIFNLYELKIKTSLTEAKSDTLNDIIKLKKN